MCSSIVRVDHPGRAAPSGHREQVQFMNFPSTAPGLIQERRPRAREQHVVVTFCAKTFHQAKNLQLPAAHFGSGIKVKNSHETSGERTPIPRRSYSVLWRTSERCKVQPCR